MNRIIPNGIAALITSATFFAVPANADPVGMEATRGSDAWQFGALIYIYYPAIGGQATLPNGTTSSITVDASDLVSNLKFGFLGSFEARKGVTLTGLLGLKAASSLAPIGNGFCPITVISAQVTPT